MLAFFQTINNVRVQCTHSLSSIGLRVITILYRSNDAAAPPGVPCFSYLFYFINFILFYFIFQHHICDTTAESCPLLPALKIENIYSVQGITVYRTRDLRLFRSPDMYPYYSGELVFPRHLQNIERTQRQSQGHRGISTITSQVPDMADDTQNRLICSSGVPLQDFRPTRTVAQSQDEIAPMAMILMLNSSTCPILG